MKSYKVLGLMSGTSLDGLDLAYCHIYEEQKAWQFEIIKTHSIPYGAEMRKELKESIFLSANELLVLHNSYGSWLGSKAAAFISDHQLRPDLIASHGHTTHHKPEKGLTFQIGNGQHLANASGVKTVCDFRTMDVALNGEGAPLVPIGDQLFFNKFDFCLNLGGISNMSFVKNGQRIAYDIGLANMVLNHLTQKTGLNYDDNGNLARKGQINEKLLQQLNSLKYYTLPFPKSTGYEWFVEKVVPIVDATDDTLENLLHSCIQHICQQVALQLKLHTQKEKSTLLVTGGGALNGFLIETLQAELGDAVEVEVPSRELVEFKEALVFALMGILRVEGKINVLSSVTGARKDSSSGVVYFPA